MRFEWNDQKAIANLAKHGVSFGEATEVFYDPNAVEQYNAGHSLDESRFVIIGLSSRRLLYVIYAERTADIVRIISARKADKSEHTFYERTRTINF
jgi:uncharacterized DUF497 family protein